MDKNVQAEILKYLQDNKSANTFKLARNLGIDRPKLIRELTKLHESGLIEHRTGMARFLSMPKPGALRPEEPKPVQKISKLKTERPRIKKQILPVNIKLRLAEENKKLRAKLAELKSHFEQQAGIERRLKAQNTHIGRLEEEIMTLSQKASAPPKVIRKIVIKHVPKVIVRRIPVKSTETRKMSAHLGVEAGKPATGPSWLSDIRHNISQLSVPKVFEQKIELKKISPDLSKLKDNFCQLEIPELLRKGI